jgi:Zn-dependent M16 (insulinase) family peptidase
MNVQNGQLPGGQILAKGQILASGFSILDIVDLAEMQAMGIWAKHQKTGVEVFHILNDDSENLFAFAFATAPEDNTGVAHILEHTTLCGSEHYPLKDAFLVLAQGSLQTFLNAYTAPDKTVYPASSINEHDYFNLMSVYGDAVFRPLLSEWAFMQEGYRYEFTKNDKLSITGVVYNEMKGVYSSLDSYANLWAVKSVLPDTPCNFELGGNPEFIPQLSWEGLKNYHRRCYSPANCRIFLAGNIPTEKQLSFLNERFFSSIEGGTTSPRIAKQQPWTKPKEFRIPCPASGEIKDTVFLSWLCFNATNINEEIALGALIEILLGHDGSPLEQALIESGLGEDISPVSGLQGELGETLFVVGLRGVHKKGEKAAKQVEAFILGELQRLVVEGIPKEEIEAALLTMEFSQREIKRSGGPFSLVWMDRTLRSWLHRDKPWENLLLVPAMNELKQRLATNNRYFESLIQQYLLDNPHRALVTLEPQKKFLSLQEAQIARDLDKVKQKLSAADKKSIIEKSVALEKMQGESDSPEALASIPHLSLSDISIKSELIPRRHEDLCGIPALCHDIFTNGISYINLAFPVDTLQPEDYLWLPFFAGAIFSVGLPGMDYTEVSSLLARTVGELNVNFSAGSVAPTANDSPLIKIPSGEFDLAGRDWIIYSLKCLDEKTAPSLDIVQRLLNEADFSDHKRIKNLVLEMKNDVRSSLAPLGQNYASRRAERFSSPATMTNETWNGITQFLFVHRLAEMDPAEVAAKLEYLRAAITSGGFIANLTGSTEALGANCKFISQRFSRFGSPKRGIGDQGSLFGLSEYNSEVSLGSELRSPVPDPQSLISEIFASPSLQIGFAAMSLRAAAFDTPAQAAEKVLSHHLSTGALWETIRMKGGAYGAFASSDSLKRYFSLSTYRDPNPLRSLDSFSSIIKDACSVEIDDIFRENLVKTIIGCYASRTSPLTPAGKGILDFRRFISRIDNDYRKRNLERIISVSAEDIVAAYRSLASQLESGPIGQVIITGTKDAEQAAKALGTEVQILPV